LETERSDEVQMIFFALTEWRIISTGLKIFILCNMSVAMNLIYMQGHTLEGTSVLSTGASEKEISQEIRPSKAAILNLCGAGNFSITVCMWPT